MPLRRLPALLLLAMAFARSARGDGLPVGPVPGEAQSVPTVTSDGRGGAVVTYKTASLKVGAVHVNGSGSPDAGIGFPPSTMPFALEATEPVRLALPSDSQVVVVSDRATAVSPVMTSMRSDGNASAGFPVGLSMPYRHAAVVPGLGGRTLIVSKNSDAVTFWTLRAAIIGVNGSVQSSIELPSPVQFFNADRLDATTDGAGGLIAVFPYYDATASGSKDLAVFRYAANGTCPWGQGPRPMVFASNDQVDVHIVADGHGGALMAWTDPRIPSHLSDIYALHIDSDAFRVPGWGFYGQPVCDAAGEQSQSQLASDGTGGIWVVWKDQRTELAGDLRFSHVLGNGQFAAGFNSSGTELVTAPGVQADAALTGDGAGGCFVVWRDERNGNADIYAQHVLANGTLSAGWAVNGRALTTAAGTQDQPSIASVAGGRAIVAWRDARSGATRIYGQAIVDAATTDAPATRPGALRLSAVDPARGEVNLRLTLPAGGRATLQLLDIAGRVRAASELLGPAEEQAVALRPGHPLEPGLYFARVRQGVASACVRVTVLR